MSYSPNQQGHDISTCHHIVLFLTCKIPRYFLQAENSTNGILKENLSSYFLYCNSANLARKPNFYIKLKKHQKEDLNFNVHQIKFNVTIQLTNQTEMYSLVLVRYSAGVINKSKA